MSKTYALGIDVGGSHLTAAIINVADKKILLDTKVRDVLDSQIGTQAILDAMISCITTCLNKFGNPVLGIGVSVPGPFDYKNGISKIYKCNKYDNIFGVDLKTYLFNNLQNFIGKPSDVVFTNDASCFLVGEAWSNSLKGEKMAAITLGTGIGSGFMINGKIVCSGDNIPNDGEVYNLPFKEKRAEDWLGAQWFLNKYEEYFNTRIENVKKIADKADTSEIAQQIFEEFGSNLGEFLAPLLSDFKADHLILGGNIAKSFRLFKSSFEKNFKGDLPKIIIAKDTENSAILGAVQNLLNRELVEQQRTTDQHLMPLISDGSKTDSYDIFPDFQISKGSITHGYKNLAKEISQYSSVIIDGYMGVYWGDFIANLTHELKVLGLNNTPFSVSSAYKSSEDIDQMIAPYLGGDDAVFGKIYPGKLTDFFDLEKLHSIEKSTGSINILYGCGASLSKWEGKVIYIDIPKNEIQYRSRAGNLFNIGAEEVLEPKSQYKRMFFIDWQVLNKHKQEVLPILDYIVDGQYLDTISWSSGDTLREGLKELSKNAFRARPWFSPGVWGGDWMKEKFTQLNGDVVNYAWSFELIAPENGLVLSDKGVRLEVSFDMLQYLDNEAILGDAAETFGTDFPIRFDYLDTFDGDNLSLQCHPTPEFIRENFGEKFTQDETYYILEAAPDAEVYLGFKEGVQKQEFHDILVNSHKNKEAIQVDDYIQVYKAKKHDLFLIPHGTIHCSGKNNLVLEISSTPYIYTFKMYDWMRMDLDGSPRPLNIERGMQNVNFECQGAIVPDQYISKESISAKDADWQIVKLSTHPKHFYEINRFEFNSRLEIETNGQCHILNLVEGTKIRVITGERELSIHYAETFVIPAATQKYVLINMGKKRAKVIQSNVKANFCDTRFR